MTLNIYIDPSINAPGLAAFVDGKLISAEVPRPWARSKNKLAELYTHAHDWANALPTSYPLGRVYYEQPQLRARGKGAKPEDLFKLSMSIGALVASVEERMPMCPLEPVIITDWKGQLPKEITTEHMWRVLTKKEQRDLHSSLVDVAPSFRHNAYDAVCIGLYKEGRATWKRKR